MTYQEHTGTIVASPSDAYARQPRVTAMNLTRKFGKNIAVDNASFSMMPGRIYGFVGPNGAGKTTTMRVMATLDEPDAGDVLLDGTSVVEYPENARRKIGFMPDALPEHKDITVLEYIDFFGRAFGLKGKALNTAREEVMEFTGLNVMREKTLAALSKGMKQRVSLARAIVHDPSVLILDEPAAGLDPRARIELRELVRALSKNGKTLLISSHILSELAELCDDIIIIEKGVILKRSSMAHISEPSASEVTSQEIEIVLLETGEDARRKLLETAGINSVTQNANSWLVTANGGDAAAAETLRNLVESGAHVVSFHPHRSSLEDIFMKVTKGTLA